MPEEGYESFDDFVRRRSVALQRFAYLVTHDREDAQDCVQDALIGLLPLGRRRRDRARGRLREPLDRQRVGVPVA